MKKITILGLFLMGFFANSAFAEEISLENYLIDEGVSFMTAKNQGSVSLSTFGWLVAAEACTKIQEMGFHVDSVRNYSENDGAETEASCN